MASFPREGGGGGVHPCLYVVLRILYFMNEFSPPRCQKSPVLYRCISAGRGRSEFPWGFPVFWGLRSGYIQIYIMIFYGLAIRDSSGYLHLYPIPQEARKFPSQGWGFMRARKTEIRQSKPIKPRRRWAFMYSNILLLSYTPLSTCINDSLLSGVSQTVKVINCYTRLLYGKIVMRPSHG